MAEPSVLERLAANLSEEEPEPEEAPEAVEPEKEPETELPEESAEEPDDAVADHAVEIQSLSELAEYLELDPKDIFGLTGSIDLPDGQTLTTSIGEWKDSYRSSKILERERSELQALRESQAKELQTKEQHIQRELEFAKELIQTAERTLLGDIERINWDELRETDPGMAALRRQEMVERKDLLSQAKKDLEARQNQAQRELQEKQAEDFRALRSREQAALLKAFPKWSDPEVAQAEWAKAAEALTSVGFTEAEIGQVMDHRAYRLAMLAAKGLEASKKTDVAKKRVLKIGKKVLKPGASQSKADAKDDAYRTQRAKLRKSGNPRDAVELIKGLL